MSVSVSVTPSRAHHGSHDGFHPDRMGKPEHGDFLHPGVAVQDFLDLAAGDVLAAGLDHVLLAVDDVQ